MAGYSKTPLVKKLGFKPEMKVTFLDAPDSYLGIIQELPAGCAVSYEIGQQQDLVHLFARNIQALESRIVPARNCISTQGALWISWPKKSSSLYLDLDGNIVRELGLGAGLVDIKVCAIDDIWSALKFVYRVRDR